MNPDHVTTIAGGLKAVMLAALPFLVAIPFPWILIPLGIYGAAEAIQGYYTNKPGAGIQAPN